jgi:hypothetical protein
MDDPVELGGTEWTLVELVDERVELGNDETVPHLVLDLEEGVLDGARLTLLQGDEAVAKLEAGARPEDTALR